MIRILCFALVPLSLFPMTEQEGLRRVDAHLLIDDPQSALQEAKTVVAQFPESEQAKGALLRAFAANGYEKEALDAWHALSKDNPELIADRNLLEELSWGVLKKGVDSTQYGVRLAALVGAYLTRDVRAVPILQKMMRDSNAVVRSVAIQMACGYGDAPLKDEIVRMMEEEKVWMVRLELINAIGAMRMKGLSHQLSQLIESDRTTYEERQFATRALLAIYEKLPLEKWEVLAKSNRAGMRYLACSIAEHFQIEGALPGICRLVSDPHPDVRIAALNALGLFYRKQMKQKEVKETLSSALVDPNASVAITASWVALLVDSKLGEQYLSSWLTDSLPENRRLAAAAVAAAGEKGVSLATTALQSNQDPYVRANVALGLLGQREEVTLCCDTIAEFVGKERRLWMWDTQQNPLFQVLAPSRVRYIDHIPNYPEAIDQMTRLNLVSLLAIVEDPRAVDSLKDFLQKRSWGITGVAAATLLQEGDDTALEIVRQLLQESDPNIRLQACLVLAMLGRDETVLSDLQEAYVDADHEQKLHILEALGRIGNSSCFAFLVGILNEPFPILRVAAAAALIQSLNR